MVLIVAKCIVNYDLFQQEDFFCNVLIVAKCIVNRKKVRYYNEGKVVLIVAKCIVNGHVRIIIKGLIEY